LGEVFHSFPGYFEAETKHIVIVAREKLSEVSWFIFPLINGLRIGADEPTLILLLFGMKEFHHRVDVPDAGLSSWEKYENLWAREALISKLKVWVLG
jgi:hypothetical protein